MDLIQEISTILGFNYTIKLVDDGKYGSFDKKSGKWNGMIGKLQIDAFPQNAYQSINRDT